MAPEKQAGPAHLTDQASGGGLKPKARTMVKAFLVGVGLVGGSLGMALRASGRYVVDGFDIDRRCLDRALALGALDRAARSLDEAVGADLVVVATPLLAMRPVFAELERCLKSARGRKPVVTDVGSAKGYVLALAREHLAPDVPFVGGHPMAGSEHSGVEHASPVLLKGCHYILTPAEWAKDADVRVVMEACEAAEAVPQVTGPDEHDAMVAATSHLPLIVAACLAQVVGKRSAVNPSIWDLAAGGFRDTTRVSSGDPEMGAGMLLANASQVLKALDEFERELNEIRRLIATTQVGLNPAGVEAVEQFLVRARASRQAWLDRRRFAHGVDRVDDMETPDTREVSRRVSVCPWTSPIH